MTYFLDTNAVVAVLRNRPERVRERLRRTLARGSAISISSVVLFELWYGVARSTRPRENAGQVRAFLAGDVNVVPFDDEDGRAAGALRGALSLAGKIIGPYDLMIAAQALRRGWTLVTANQTEFARIPGLTLQDWSTSRS